MTENISEISAWQKIFEDIIKSMYQLMWNVQSYNNIVLFVNNILEIPIKAQIIMKFIEQIILAFVEIGAFLQKIFD